MRIRFLQAVATLTDCFQQGNVYDIDDAEAQRLIDAGQATDDLSMDAQPRAVNRQTMDRQTGTPVEEIPHTQFVSDKGTNLPASNSTLPSQTAAGVEAQAGAEKDRAHVLTTNSGMPTPPPSDESPIPIDVVDRGFGGETKSKAVTGAKAPPPAPAKKK